MINDIISEAKMINYLVMFSNGIQLPLLQPAKEVRVSGDALTVKK